MAKVSEGARPVGKPPTYNASRWELLRRWIHAAPPTQGAADFLYFAGPLGNSSAHGTRHGEYVLRLSDAN